MTNLDQKSILTYENVNAATRGATRCSIWPAVFLTTELLENILRHLPMRDLLFVHRVCRKWRAVICESKQLQQALYLVPLEPLERWKYEKRPEAKVTRVPSDTPARTQKDLGTPNIYQIATPNPLLYRDAYHVNNHVKLAQPGYNLLKVKYLTARDSGEASRRRMLATQPAITSASLTFHFEQENPAERRIRLADVFNSTGITDGDVAKHASNSYIGGSMYWQRLSLQASHTIFVSESERSMNDEDLQAIV